MAPTPRTNELARTPVRWSILLALNHARKNFDRRVLEKLFDSLMRTRAAPREQFAASLVRAARNVVDENVARWLSGVEIVAADAEDFFELSKRAHASLCEPRGKFFDALMRPVLDGAVA
jgi:hypothetical protein